MEWKSLNAHLLRAPITLQKNRCWCKLLMECEPSNAWQAWHRDENTFIKWITFWYCIEFTNLMFLDTALTITTTPSLKSSPHNWLVLLLKSLFCLVNSVYWPGKICQFWTSFCQTISPMTSVRVLSSLKSGESGSWRPSSKTFDTCLFCSLINLRGVARKSENVNIARHVPWLT